jgi:2-octaprenyl-6-methoxyphenol hydroxylase
MTIRDIKILSKIIQNKIDLGLQLDISILRDFENQTKNKNFMFSNGIDFIYEFFSLEKKLKIKNLTKILKVVGKNNNFNNLLIKIADRGINL